MLCPKEIRSALAAVWLPGGTGFLIGNMISGCASSTWISFMLLFSTYYPCREQQTATSYTIIACNLGMCIALLFGTCFYSTTRMRFLCTAGVCGGMLGPVLTSAAQEKRQDASAAAFVGMTAALLYYHHTGVEATK